MLLDQFIDEPGQMLRRELLIQRWRQQRRLPRLVVPEHLPDRCHLRGRPTVALHHRDLDQPLLNTHQHPPSPARRSLADDSHQTQEPRSY